MIQSADLFKKGHENMTSSTSQNGERTARRILLVDDDSAIRGMLASAMEKGGMSVKQASCVTEAQTLLSRNDFHAIVLDWMMPGEDGASFLRRLRSSGDTTPVIMLSAKTDEIDRILGLESGADDYVPKPFSAREVMARLSAIWRRMETPPPSAPVNGLSLPLADGTLDCDKRTFSREGLEPVQLSDAEFAVAKAFARNPGNTPFARPHHDPLRGRRARRLRPVRGRPGGPSQKGHRRLLRRPMHPHRKGRRILPHPEENPLKMKPASRPRSV